MEPQTSILHDRSGGAQTRLPAFIIKRAAATFG